MIDLLRRRGILKGVTRTELSYQRGYDDGHKLGLANLQVEKNERRIAQEDARHSGERALVSQMASRRAWEALEQVVESKSVKAEEIRVIARQALKWKPAEEDPAGSRE